jgi:hypothetical protein
VELRFNEEIFIVGKATKRKKKKVSKCFALLLLFIFLFVFFKTGSLHIAQAGLKLMILLPLAPESWDYRSGPSHPPFLFNKVKCDKFPLGFNKD